MELRIVLWILFGKILFYSIGLPSPRDWMNSVSEDLERDDRRFFVLFLFRGIFMKISIATAYSVVLSFDKMKNLVKNLFVEFVIPSTL